MPIVRIPPPYRGPTQGEASVEVEGDSVRACIDSVERRFPGFAAQVVQPDGRPHRFVKLFVNGEPVDGPEHPVSPDDEVEVLAAIAGG